MSRLEELKNLIESEFPENWHEKYEFANRSQGYKAKNQKVIENIVTDQDTFEENFFEYLNFSAIEGEHIRYHDLSSQLTEIKDLVRSRLFSLLRPPSYIREEVESRLSSFENELIGSLTFYELVSSQISRNLKHSRRKHLFEQLDKYKNDLTVKRNSNISRDLTEAFAINMYSLRADHMPLLDREVLKVLISFAAKLSDERFTYVNVSYVKIVLNRVRFLVRKMIYRYQERETPFIYIIDSRETELSADQFSIDIFKSLDEKCLTHYEKHHNYVARLKSEYESIAGKDPSKLNFSQYHLKTKYFKDISKQATELEKVVDNFNKHKLEKNYDNLLNRAAANTSINYLQNNALSLRIEADEASGESIAIAFKAAMELQNDTGVENYFPYNKYLFWLSENIEKQFEGGVNSTHLNLLQHDISEYKSTLSRFRSALEWSEDHYFLAYQLPFEECITEELVNGQKYNIFLASSFVLPIDYSKVHEDVEKHQNNLVRYELLLQFNKDIQPERRQLELIQQEVKGTERRTIEILGIFAALVIFAAGTINTLRFNYSPWVAFLFMFALGSSLSTFVAVIITVARGADHFKQNRSIYLTLSGIGVLCWVFLLVFGGDAEQKSPNQVQPQTTAPVTKDSLEQISEDGDSLRIRPVPDSIKR